MVPSPYPSVIERYYKKFYYKYEDKPDEDLCVLVHSNKVCIVTLTPEHKVFKHGPIKSLKYLIESDGKKVGDVHGKRKLQAIKTNLGIPLCEITASDGTKFVIDCPVRGKLLELNDTFQTDLSLLDTKSETSGYLAIVLHQFSKNDFVCNYLLSEEQYLQGETLQYSKNKVNRNKGGKGNEKMDTDSSHKRKDDSPLNETDPKRPKIADTIKEECK